MIKFRTTSNYEFMTSLVTLSMPTIPINFRIISLKTTIFTLILFFSFSLTAQKRNSINYLNEKPPGLVAQIFAPGILSTAALEHSSPAFSPDGKTVVWAVMQIQFLQMGRDIIQSDLMDLVTGIYLIQTV